MAALWSWCPTVALEAGNSAHVDMVAVGSPRSRCWCWPPRAPPAGPSLGGVLLGLAIATKLTPALAVPALLRRRWFTIAVAAQRRVHRGLRPAPDRGRQQGDRVPARLPAAGGLHQRDQVRDHRPVRRPGRWPSAVAVLILAAVALAVLQFGDPDRPWQGAVVMTAAALAVTTPHYQWYALLLVMLVALDGRTEWLAFAAGGVLRRRARVGPVYPVQPSRRRDRLRDPGASRSRRLAGPSRTGPPRTGPARTGPPLCTGRREQLAADAATVGAPGRAAPRRARRFRTVGCTALTSAECRSEEGNS